MLEKLYTKHKKFINILKKMGCCNNIAEDFVQEMYIKIHTYSLAKEIKNIDVLAYFILKNLFYDYCRKKKLTISLDGEHFDIERFDITQEDYDLEDEIQKSDQLTNLELVLQDPKVMDWYDKRILKEHYIEGVSMRRIGRETKIGFPSIYNTVKKAREQLKTALNEKHGTR